MELTTWFPGLHNSLPQIRTLLRRLSAEQKVPAEAREDVVLAGSEAAARLMAGPNVRELQLRWNSNSAGVTLELEADGILPVFEPSDDPAAPLPLLEAMLQETAVTEHVDGRPRTTVRMVRRWGPPARYPVAQAS